MIPLLAANSFIFGPFADFIGKVLAAIYAFVDSYGLSIVILSVLIRILIFPFTAKQARSMVEMQQLQPHLKRLQAKYKNDRQKLSEETMALYRANGVNPLASCLPLLIQIPIGSGLFWLLRYVPDHVPTDSKLYKSVCGAAVTKKPCTKYSLNSFGMDLSKSLKDKIGNFGQAWPYVVLVVLVVVTQFISVQQHHRRQKELSKQIRIMGMLGPVMIAFTGTIFPIGLALYYLIVNLFQIGQNEYVFRNITSKAGDGSNVIVPESQHAPEPKPPSDSPSPHQARSKKRKRR